MTSPETWDYNCIAFAAEVQDEWWWPDQHGDGFWPAGVPRKVETDAFVQAYASLGYDLCVDGSFEVGYEKIALYEKDGTPTHAAKQTLDGKWKSKLGRLEDIVHNTPTGVETHAGEGIYGRAVLYMRRQTPV